MARKEMILTDAGAARYRTRMLSAGDPIVLDGPTARLYGKIGWAADKPKRATRAAPEPVIPTVEEVLSAEVVEEPTKEPERPKLTVKTTVKKAPAKRRTTRKAAAKK